MSHVLSKDQLAFYESEGYLHLSSVLNESTLSLAESVLGSWADSVIRGWIDAGLLQNDHHEYPFQTRMLHAWRAAGQPKYLRSPRRALVGEEMFAMLRSPELLDIAADLLDASEISVHQIFNGRARLPDQKWTSTPWHQDAQYFKEAEFVHVPTFWFPLQDVDETSSCLEVQARYHHNGLQEDYDDPESGFLGIAPELAKTFKGTPVHMKRGDVLCFTQRTPHRALPNEREFVRWSMDFRYEATQTATGGSLGFVARSSDSRNETTAREWLEKWRDRDPGSY